MNSGARFSGARSRDEGPELRVWFSEGFTHTMSHHHVGPELRVWFKRADLDGRDVSNLDTVWSDVVE